MTIRLQAGGRTRSEVPSRVAHDRRSEGRAGITSGGGEGTGRVDGEMDRVEEGRGGRVVMRSVR
jgi:hypothetical protein